MKRSFETKLLFSILALAVITIIGFIAYIMATFTGGLLFYAPLVLAASAGLAVFAVIFIFELFSKRFRLIALAALPESAC